MNVFRPVAVRLQGPIAGGAIVWRYRGELHLTAIVKATFRMAPDGAMSIAPPEDLWASDVHVGGEPRLGLLRARDRVPLRPRADIVATGSTLVSGTRLRFFRDRVLLEKIAAPADASRRDIGFGPLPGSWPGGDGLFGAGEIAEIPATIDWASFQTAPPDQRTAFLHGDEQLVLENLGAGAPDITARLPGVRAFGNVDGVAAGPRSIELEADGLHVDVDRRVSTLTWRGVAPLPPGRDLAGVGLFLGITIAGKPLLAQHAPVRKHPLASTVLLPADDAPMHPGASASARSIPRSVPPQAPPLTRRPPSAPLSTTVELDAPPPVPSNTPAWLERAKSSAVAPASSPPRAQTRELTREEVAALPVAPFPIAAARERASEDIPTDATPWGSTRPASKPVPARPSAVTMELAPPSAREVPVQVAPEMPDAPASDAKPEPSAQTIVEPVVEPPVSPAPRPLPPPRPNANDGLYRRFTQKKK